MILDRVRAYLSGNVVVKIRGVELEKLINAASRAGIVMGSVKRHGRYLLTSRVAMSDYRRLRRLLPSAQYRIEIIGKHGLPLLLQRLRKRRMLLAGLAISIALLYYMSSFVWFIRITGHADLAEESLRRFIEDRGIRIGTRKSEVDTAALERDLAIKFSRISWVAVSIRGTLLSVDIAEKLVPTSDHVTVFDVVAAKPGLIVKFIPLAGTPLVSEGHTVEAGQVLVEAIRSTPQGEGAEGEAVSARAVVEARVWYQATTQVKLKDKEAVRTGRTKTIRHCHVLGLDIPIGWPFGEFNEFEVEERQAVIPLWPGSRIGVATTIITRYETVSYPVARTADQARAEAIRLARGAALMSVPEGVEVVDEIATVSPIGEGDDGAIHVEYTIETIEDIAVERASSAVNATKPDQ